MGDIYYRRPKRRYRRMYGPRSKSPLLKGTRKTKRKGFTTSEVKAVFENYSRNCFYCGDADSDIQIDHVIPISAGGKHTIKNFVPCCKSCNAAKNNYHPVTLLWKLYKRDSKLTDEALKMLKDLTEGISIGDYNKKSETWVLSKIKTSTNLLNQINSGLTFDQNQKIWNEIQERERKSEAIIYYTIIGIIGLLVFILI